MLTKLLRESKFDYDNLTDGSVPEAMRDVRCSYDLLTMMITKFSIVRKAYCWEHWVCKRHYNHLPQEQWSDALKKTVSDSGLSKAMELFTKNTVGEAH